MFGIISKVTGPTTVCFTHYHLKHNLNISHQPISRTGNASLGPVIHNLFYTHPMHDDDSELFFAYSDIFQK